MKSTLTSLFLAGCCLPVVAGAIQVVSLINAPQDKHEFANIESPLWNNIPTKVDRERQNYERLPALVIADANLVPSTEHLVVHDANEIPIPSAEQQTPSDTEHLRLRWCQQRYISYREEDNSYQPFGGGPSRTCDAPMAAVEVVSRAPRKRTESEGSAHVQWCLIHYASYQPGDNSYRTFSGARRQCTSPFAGKGANTVQASM